MSRLAFTKDDYLYMADMRRHAFMEIAAKLGKEHAITKMMGGMAWSRSRAEQGPEPTLHSAIREMAFLDGYFDALNLWARDHDYGAQQTMLNIYPSNWTKRP